MPDAAQQLDDATLAERVRSGAPDAERELARRFYGRVFAVALAKLGDYELAEDLAQESLLRGLEALREGRVEHPERLGAYLCGTARNLSNNVLRAKRPDSVTDPDDLASPGEPTDRLCIRREHRVLVGKVLSGMRPVDQQVLLWTLVDGLPAEEVGRRLGLQPAAVRQRKHRALQRARILFLEMSQTRPEGY
jgi:RNA polymerase sigma-70 factor (ECF subfamily)